MSDEHGKHCRYNICCLITCTEKNRRRLYSINPSSSSVNMYILLTSCHTFLMAVFGRICVNIKTFDLRRLFPFLITWMFDQEVILYIVSDIVGEIRCWSLLGIFRVNMITVHSRI